MGRDSEKPDWYEIDLDPRVLAKEREKARKLKKSNWWQKKLSDGICHYCSKTFKAAELTMDHIVPIARGGKSAPGNVVPSCKKCNADKKLKTPAESLIERLGDKSEE